MLTINFMLKLKTWSVCSVNALSGKRENVFCLNIYLTMFQYGDRRLNFILVYNMACLGTGRLCARVEKLCSLGKNGPVKRKTLSFVTNIVNNNQPTRSTFHSFQVKKNRCFYPKNFVNLIDTVTWL